MLIKLSDATYKGLSTIVSVLGWARYCQFKYILHTNLDFGVMLIVFLDKFGSTMKLDVILSHQQDLKHAKSVYRRIIKLARK